MECMVNLHSLPNCGRSLTCLRAISHDPETYPDPDEFRPERFLDENGQLTGYSEDTAFGYGKRCVDGLKCDSMGYSSATIEDA
jgi:hypothetical protein